jgi:starvation-inducible DNA-binding protein
MSTIYGAIAAMPPAQFKPFSEHAIDDIASHLNPLLADALALYLKTKHCHLQIFGLHARDPHQLLDEQSEQIFEITDALAERLHMIGGETLHSVSDIARLQRISDNGLPAMPLREMLAELRADNLRLAAFMLSAQATCNRHQDDSTASLLESWIDDAQQRASLLLEASR